MKTQKIEIEMKPRAYPDSRGIMFPSNKLHPDRKHFTSRIRHLGFIALVKYEESGIIILAKEKYVSDLIAESYKYLGTQRGCNILGVKEEIIDVPLCPLVGECQTCNGEEFVTCEIFSKYAMGQQKTHTRSLAEERTIRALRRF